MNKRYLLFVFYDYYPSGGWDDFAGSFDTIENAAITAAASREDNFQVVDSESLKIVKDNFTKDKA